MVGINKMVSILAMDRDYLFKHIFFVRVEKNIKLRVRHSITHEMVVSVVVERDSSETKIKAES